MLDFNQGTEQFNRYLGAERKTTVLLDGDLYMLKYPDPIRRTKLREDLSYKNNQFSEHIGSNIFRACGMDAQETALGFFTDKDGKKKLGVGCKDFTQHGGTLYEMAKLASQTMVNDARASLSIENVYSIIEKSDLITNKQEILASFWDMFVIDALIGNADRHFGNWGLLVTGDEVKFAPVYDCGSSLGALLDDETMENILSNPALLKNQEFNAMSCYSLDGKRIFYHEIFRNPPPGLKEAIARMMPNINKQKILSIVDAVPEMSPTRKAYLSAALALRLEQILLPALQRDIEKPSLSAQLKAGVEKSKTQFSDCAQNPQKSRNDMER